MRLHALLVAALLTAASAAAQEVRATLSIEPAQAAVGEPVEWQLVVEAPAGVLVKMPPLEATVAGSWMILEALPTRRTEDAGHAIVRGGWRVFALEGGELEPPPLFVEVQSAGVTSMIPVDCPRANVAHALDDNEDEMRAAKGFRAAGDYAKRSPTVWIVGFLTLVLLLALAPFLRRLLRKKSAPRPGPTPLESLAEIEARVRAAPDAGRPIVFELTALLRRAIDEFSSEPRASEADADWSARISADERVPDGVRSATKRILASAEAWKYALETPSRFALDEVLKDARGVLEVLASTPRPAPRPSNRATDSAAREASKGAAA